MKEGKYYKIKWNDTYGRKGWWNTDEIDDKTPEASLQESVGHLVKKTKDWVIIATHRNKNHEFAEWGDINWIPVGTIKEIKEIK